MQLVSMADCLEPLEEEILIWGRGIMLVGAKDFCSTMNLMPQRRLQRPAFVDYGAAIGLPLRQQMSSKGGLMLASRVECLSLLPMVEKMISLMRKTLVDGEHPGYRYHEVPQEMTRLMVVFEELQLQRLDGNIILREILLPPLDNQPQRLRVKRVQLHRCGRDFAGLSNFQFQQVVPIRQMWFVSTLFFGFDTMSLLGYQLGSVLLQVPDDLEHLSTSVSQMSFLEFVVGNL